MKTRDVLGVFWKGEETDGIQVYALWRGELLTAPRFPERVWPAGTEFDAYRLWGDSWTVWLWTLRIHAWPAAAEWAGTVSSSLDALLSAGAAVAWCGVEGAFEDPPSLFDPSRYYAALTDPDHVAAEWATGVWACRSTSGLHRQAPGLDEDFVHITWGDLGRLHEEVTNLLADPRA